MQLGGPTQLVTSMSLGDMISRARPPRGFWALPLLYRNPSLPWWFSSIDGVIEVALVPPRSYAVRWLTPDNGRSYRNLRGNPSLGEFESSQKRARKNCWSHSYCLSKPYLLVPMDIPVVGCSYPRKGTYGRGSMFYRECSPSVFLRPILYFGCCWDVTLFYSDDRAPLRYCKWLARFIWAPANCMARSEICAPTESRSAPLSEPSGPQ